MPIHGHAAIMSHDICLHDRKEIKKMNKPVEVQGDAVREAEAVSSVGVLDTILEDTQIRLVESASGIVASYVGLNKIAPEDINGLIESVHATLTRLMSGTKPDVIAESAARPVPVVDPKESVFPDYIICLEDGKKLKMLKRHLKAAYSMTPAEYRERWQLPPEYPMTAPNYSAQRTAIAKHLGLGQRGQSAEPEPAPAPATRTRSKAVPAPAPAAPVKTPAKQPTKKTARRSR